MREEVSSKIAEVAKRTNVSTSSIVENLTGKMRQVAAYTDVNMSRSVGELQSKTRECIEGHRHDLEAKIEQNQAEARHTANETKAAVDQLSMQLAKLATQLAEFQPAQSVDVAIGQHHVSQDVIDRL